jgi:hypothetical protein
MRRRTFLKVAGAAAALPSVVVPTMAAAGEPVSVTAINREAHTIAKSEATWDPDADYTFVQGDFLQSGPHGLEAWMPTSTPHSETFFGE